MQQLETRTIHIDITFAHKEQDMSHKPKTDTNIKDFLCPICLSFKEGRSPPCSVCEPSYQNCRKKNRFGAKSTQTPKTKDSLQLLNEVLTVFQSKKVTKNPVSVKDAGVSCNLSLCCQNLSYCKMFKISLDGVSNNKPNCIVLTSSCWEKTPNLSLIINKASSIPLTKVDFLKNAGRVPKKSKNTIEEVNRMFANVNTCVAPRECNRPLVRNGPRVLPVVLNTNASTKCECCDSPKCMSSGDSLAQKNEENFENSSHKNLDSSLRNSMPKKNDLPEQNICIGECMYLLCCHYKKSRNGEFFACEQCRQNFTKSPNL